MQRLAAHLGLLTLALPAAAQDQKFFNYLDGADYPADANPGFHDDVQGVTHDGAHWYFTQTYKIWKVPVGVALHQDLSSHPLVAVHDAEDDIEPFDHLGDPAHYGGYLVVPLQGQSPKALAFFKASDLSYVGQATIPFADAAWCAIDAGGRVYMSSYDEKPDRMLEFEVGWSLLSEQVQVDLRAEHALTDLAGAPVHLQAPQGGDFSTDGRWLYYVGSVAPSWVGGIQVFDTTTWEWIEHSELSSGLFQYYYGELEGDEPEGICVWDLDGGQAPNIAGQMHVLTLDNDFPSADEIWFKHYTHRVFVDPGPSPEAFPTVSAALAAIDWEGATLAIGPASYDESFVLSTPMLLTHAGGTGSVVIGE